MFEEIVVQLISKVHPCHVDKRFASMWTASPNRGAHGLMARSVGVTTARSCAWSVARTLNVSLPKVTRHFSVQLLLPWLVLCSAGGSITSQRLYLALETFWVSWAYSGCALCNVSHAGYWSFLTISDWVGLAQKVCWKFLSCVPVLLTGHWPIISSLWISWTALSISSVATDM